MFFFCEIWTFEIMNVVMDNKREVNMFLYLSVYPSRTLLNKNIIKNEKICEILLTLCRFKKYFFRPISFWIYRFFKVISNSDSNWKLKREWNTDSILFTILNNFVFYIFGFDLFSISYHRFLHFFLFSKYYLNIIVG